MRKCHETSSSALAFLSTARTARWACSGQGERVSQQLITEYRSDLDRIHSASGSKRESVVREAFKDLLKRWGKSRDLIVLAEHDYLTPHGDRRYIDGALVHSIRVPFGYWEAKGTNDDLDEEIRKKTAIGYPRDNIIYEDTRQAILIQNNREVARAPMDDADKLFQLLESFFAYERQAVAAVSEEDVEEMLIQHVLTEDIFAKVFDN